MPVYLRGGIGPLRASVRLGGPRRRSPEVDSEASMIFGGVALVAFGAWAAVEGLQGRWGNVGRGFGVIFILVTLAALANRVAATALLTSWIYWGLAKLGYFEWMILASLRPQENFEFGLSVDQSFMWLLTAVLGLAGVAATVALPPLVVGLVVHSVAGALAASSQGAHVPAEGVSEDLEWIPPRNFGPVAALVHGWVRAFDVRSRASRSEFWLFFAMQIAAWLALPLTFRFIRPYMSIETFDFYSNAAGYVFAWIGLVMPIPIVSAAVRRLHDLNMRGWWIVVPLVFPIVLLRPGTKGPNRFG